VVQPTYGIHDTTGDDRGLIEHPATNVEPGDAEDRRKRISSLTARIGPTLRRQRLFDHTAATQRVPQVRCLVGVPGPQ
jgi:hypothetical protein